MTRPQKRVRSERGLAAMARVRRVTAGLPEVEEEVDKFGHTSFRVRSKPFVMMGEGDDGPSVAVKADAKTQAKLVAEGHFRRTPYIGQHGWVSTDVPPANWGEVDELIVGAYLQTAPTSLARQVLQA